MSEGVCKLGHTSQCHINFFFQSCVPLSLLTHPNKESNFSLSFASLLCPWNIIKFLNQLFKHYFFFSSAISTSLSRDGTRYNNIRICSELFQTFQIAFFCLCHNPTTRYFNFIFLLSTLNTSDAYTVLHT